MKLISTVAALAIVAVSLAELSGSAQTYSVDWHKVAGGGGTSSGGAYSVSGTIGQPDAGGPLLGGDYSVTGGFWSLISVVPTAGLPNLSIGLFGNSVVVSWPETPNCTLEQSGDLSPASWTASGYPITTFNGTNSIRMLSPSGKLFFRLKR